MAAACDGGGPDAGSPTPVAPPGAATAAPCQALAEASSFRYVSKVTLESPETTETPTADLPSPSGTVTRAFGGPFLYQYDVDASVVTPDRFRFTITTTDVSSVSIIAIGQEVWQETDGTWQTQTEPQREEIDGLEAIHYTFLKNASPQGVAKVFSESSDMALLIKTLDVNLWLSEDGDELVRLEFQGKGLYSDGRPLMVHVVVDVRDINDEDIKVEPPI